MKILSRVLLFIAAVVLALIQIPTVAAIVDNLPLPFLWLIIGIVIIAATINFFNPEYTPSLKVMEMSKDNEEKLNSAVLQLNKAYKKHGIQFNVNIMLTETVFFRSIEPKKSDPTQVKFSFFLKIFKVIWSSPDGVNDELKISINQGVCGAAYREGTATSFTQIKGASLSTLATNQESYNFSNRQKQWTEGLTLVASCPLVIVKRGKRSQIRTKIGVLNVESRSANTDELFTDPAKRKLFCQTIANLAVLYTNLCS